MCLAGTVVASWSLTQRGGREAKLSPFTVMTNIFFTEFNKFILKTLLHPAETSKNSDICDFSKNSDIGKSIVLNGETYILNDTTQFREDLMEIYI